MTPLVMSKTMQMPASKDVNMSQVMHRKEPDGTVMVQLKFSPQVVQSWAKKDDEKSS